MKAEVYNHFLASLGEEVVAEVKVCFIYTVGAPGGNSTFDFHGASSALVAGAGPRAPEGLPDHDHGCLLCRAGLHQPEERDSLCLWPFNQKRIPAEDRQWSKGRGGGGGERRCG